MPKSAFWAHFFVYRSTHCKRSQINCNQSSLFHPSEKVTQRSLVKFKERKTMNISILGPGVSSPVSSFSRRFDCKRSQLNRNQSSLHYSSEKVIHRSLLKFTERKKHENQHSGARCTLPFLPLPVDSLPKCHKLSATRTICVAFQKVTYKSRGADLYSFGWALGPPILSSAPQ